MLRYLVPLIILHTSSSANSWKEWNPSHHLPRRATQLVASESQVKFAVENNFDDTGPGAKQPEYAYHTYKNLDDALVAYLDDPDTKLPEQDKQRAILKLTQQDLRQASRLFQKNEAYKIPKPQYLPQSVHTEVYNMPVEKHFYDQDSKVGKLVIDANEVAKTYKIDKKVEPIKFHKIHKGVPLSLAHYTRDPSLQAEHIEFNAHPKYTFAYEVHDSKTGDSKAAQESRDGGNVHGFYSFIDSDGKTRTVHYTADDRKGFRAKVQKS